MDIYIEEELKGKYPKLLEAIDKRPDTALVGDPDESDIAITKKAWLDGRIIAKGTDYPTILFWYMTRANFVPFSYGALRALVAQKEQSYHIGGKDEYGDWDYIDITLFYADPEHRYVILQEDNRYENKAWTSFFIIDASEKPELFLPWGQGGKQPSKEPVVRGYRQLRDALQKVNWGKTK